MTIGIYKISFKDTDRVYIGQSSNIEARWCSHLSDFRNKRATPKLQQAYDRYGIKKFDIILECCIDELNSAEKEAIEIYNSYVDGFNSLSDARAPILPGEDNPNAAEINEKYMEVLRLLVQESPSLTKREISKISNVSIYVINHIAALESHAWLKERMPLEYKLLEDRKHNNKYYRGKQYPQVKSPDGMIYDVVHVTNFAKQHGLLQPKLSEVMSGNRNHHKGWTLAIR
jgi:group I intron endonuclease